MRKLRILIADDEPLARRGLAIMLEQMGDIELVGRAGDGQEAVVLCAKLRPDIILLDIGMPDLDGFETLQAMGSDAPVVIFVTAYSQFATRAFDIDATDYVLKPVASDRLRAAVNRARTAIEQASAAERVAELDAVIVSLRSSTGTDGPKRFASELWIPQRSEHVRVPVATIERIVAEREYAHIHTSQGSHLLRQSINHFEQVLDPALFVRLRRSVIARRDRISAVRQAGPGALAVEFTDGSRIRVGRTYVARVRRLVEIAK